MLKSLQQKIAGLLADNNTDAGNREDAIRLATATLLAEVAAADGTIDGRERDVLSASLTARFALTPEDVALVLGQGFESAEHAVSLQGFTRTLHENLADDEKAHIVAMLWGVAAADGHIDPREDALIAQIGELLYVPRSRVLQLRTEALQTL